MEILIILIIFIFSIIYNLRKEKKIGENNWIFYGLITTSLGILLPIALLVIAKENPKLGINMPDNLASIGDFLGGSMVGLLTLASVLFFTAALFMQKEELGLQRDDLQNSIKELAQSNQNLKKQNIDNTFFNLIDYTTSLSKELSKENTFKEFYKNYKIYMEKKKEEILFSYFKNNTDQLKSILDNIESNVDDFSKEALENVQHLLLNFDEVKHVLSYKDIFPKKSISKTEDKPKKKIHFLTSEQREKWEDADLGDYEIEKYRIDEEKRRYSVIEYILIKLFKDNYIYFFENYDLQIAYDSNKLKEIIYNDFYFKQSFGLLHYFKNLHTVIEYILNTDLSLKEKKEYLIILEAQLSPYERYILSENLECLEHFKKINMDLNICDLNIFIGKFFNR